MFTASAQHLKHLRYPKASLGVGRNICQPERIIAFLSPSVMCLGVTAPFQTPYRNSQQELRSKRARLHHSTAPRIQCKTSISSTRGHTQASAGIAELCELSDTLQTYPNFILNSFPLGTSPLSYKVATEDLCVCCQIAQWHSQRYGSPHSGDEQQLLHAPNISPELSADVFTVCSKIP